MGDTLAFSQVLTNTLCVATPDDDPKPLGTCFIVGHGEKRYLITAAHVYRQAAKNDSMVFICGTDGGKREPEAFRQAFVGIDDKHDVAVALILGEPPSLHLSNTDGIVIGERCQFFGYPFGLGTWSELGVLGLMPMVKSATISSLDFATKTLWLDGINNPGFSGGPVVYRQLPNSTHVEVIGIVSAYRQDWDTVKAGSPSGTTVRTVEGENLIYVRNSGLIKACSSKVALDIIESG